MEERLSNDMRHCCSRWMNEHLVDTILYYRVSILTMQCQWYLNITILSVKYEQTATVEGEVDETDRKMKRHPEHTKPIVQLQPSLQLLESWNAHALDSLQTDEGLCKAMCDCYTQFEIQFRSSADR